MAWLGIVTVGGLASVGCGSLASDGSRAHAREPRPGAVTASSAISADAPLAPRGLDSTSVGAPSPDRSQRSSLALTPTATATAAAARAGEPERIEPARGRWQMTSLWRAGAGLAAAPELGPDGAIYVISRQGTLDVLEPVGRHRFTITLGGTPTGAFYVDERGAAYVGLATGSLVAISAQGQRTTIYHWPKAIVGGIAFAPGQGLLFKGDDGVTIGINRGGFATLRVDARAPVTAGPLGLFGWCVVATAFGDVLWANRAGKRIRTTVEGAVRELQAAPSGGVWALSSSGLFAFSRGHALEFRRTDVLQMSTLADLGVLRASTGPFGTVRGSTTEPSRNASSERDTLATPTRLSGAVLTTANVIEWLESGGAALVRAPLGFDEADQAAYIRLDGAGRVWLATQAGRLYVANSTGQLEFVLDQRGEAIVEPRVDLARGRVVLATAAGHVFSVVWRSESP